MKILQVVTGLTVFPLFIFLSPVLCNAFSNGPDGDAYTDDKDHPSCENIPYSTHDWIAEHAKDWLPETERSWIDDNLGMFLLGTEAPDNSRISAGCSSPNQGYGDTAKHHVYWNQDHIGTCQNEDDGAVRAQEEYDLARVFLSDFDEASAAFYAGAMAHYITDLAVFGHVMGKDACAEPPESHHDDYEDYIGDRTESYNADFFESYLVFDGSLSTQDAYEAALEISRITDAGGGKTKSAKWMDDNFNWGNPLFVDSAGDSLNRAVNALADVLYTLSTTAGPRVPVYNISGLIWDQKKVPVEGVVIEARDQEGIPVNTALTDEIGSFQMKLPQGKYILNPLKETHVFRPASKKIKVRKKDLARNNFKCKLFKIKGSVKGWVDGKKNKPLREIVVFLKQGDAVVASSTTDTKGKYGFEIYNTGVYTVEPVKEGSTFDPPAREVVIIQNSKGGVNFKEIQ